MSYIKSIDNLKIFTDGETYLVLLPTGRVYGEYNTLKQAETECKNAK
jgi:hypothetical protein